MGRNRSNNHQPAGQSSGRTARPGASARPIRTVTLFLLVGVVFIVAVQMIVSCVGFVLDPDPAVKAGPMYVTLVLTTGAAVLMFMMALNASFLPFVSRRQAPNVYLVMGAMGITGVVTGLLTVGGEAGTFAARLVLGAIALTFITVQNTRLARAREASPAGQAGPPAPRAKPRPQSRQRRGGRKR